MNVKDLVSFALVRTLSSKGASYLARPAGSSVDGLNVSDGDAVAAFLSRHEWLDVTDEAAALGVRFGSCRYFRAEIAEGFTGQEGIALVNELSDEDLANVRIVRGHHGNFEIQLAGQSPRPTRVMHLIIGSYESWPNGEVNADTAGIVTWYPGRLTKQSDLTDATVKFTR
jgi:hypothetical protein